MQGARVQAPELLPKIRLQGVHLRIPRQDGATESPFRRVRHQARFHRVMENVETRLPKGIPLALAFPQDAVVGLRLELRGRQRGFQISPQEGHAVALIGVKTQTHPDEMQVVRHETIGGTKQTLARGGMKHQLAEARVESSLCLSDLLTGNEPARVPPLGGGGADIFRRAA